MPSKLSNSLKFGTPSSGGAPSGSSASVSSAAKGTAKSIKSAISITNKKKKRSSGESVVSFDDEGLGVAGGEGGGGGGGTTTVGFGSSAPRFEGGELSPIKDSPSVVSGARKRAQGIFRSPKGDKSTTGILESPSLDSQDSIDVLDSAVPGTYLIQVHIIEVRDLKPADPDGSADPFVTITIEVGNKKKETEVTRTVKNDRNAIFDETFRFEFPSCAVSDIEMAMITVAVKDSDTFSSDEVIGSWEAELFDSVYARHNHEFYRQFVVLTNPEGHDAGAQGFLRLSVTVLGPDDRMPYHDLSKERDDERMAASDGALSPLQMGGGITATSTELRFIVIDIREIIDVPYYKFEYAKRLFVKAELGRVSLRTDVAEMKYKAGTNLSQQKQKQKSTLPTRKAKMHQRMTIAVVHPTMARSLRLSIWESRSSHGHGDSRCLAYLDVIKVDYIKANPEECHYMTIPFYGAPLLRNKHRKGGKEVSSKMNHSPDDASTYRGQLVVSMRDISSKRMDGSERPFKSFVEPLTVMKISSGDSAVPSEYDTDLDELDGVGSEAGTLGKGGGTVASSTVSVVEQLFMLKSQILWGCNLPVIPEGRSSPDEMIGQNLRRTILPTSPSSSSSTMQFGVRISCGKHYVETGLKSPGGWGENSSQDMCDWRSSGVRSFTFSSPVHAFSNNPSSEQNDEAEDNDDVDSEEIEPPHPDIIVTLLRGLNHDYSSSSGKVEADKNPPIPICYRRIPSSDLFIQPSEHQEQHEPMAKWIHLKEDKAIDALHDTVFPGSILIRMGLYSCGRKIKGSKPETGDASTLVPCWEDETPSDASGFIASPTATSPYPNDTVMVDVRVNVYSARDLPPADLSTGALDPYLICSLGGTTKRTSIKQDTRNPSWFETLVFQTRLPRSRDLWPELILQLWDADEASDDDFVGNLILSLKDETIKSDKEEQGNRNGDDGVGGSEILPHWNDIFFQEPGDIEQGSVLLGVECIVHNTYAFIEEDAASHEDGLSELPTEMDMKRHTKPSTSRRGEATTEKFFPQGSERTVEILALGCRDLRSPSSMYGMKAPLLSFQIGDSAPVFTPPSNRPSASNCNFGVKLQIENVYLPDDDELAPFLQVKVLDGSVKFKSFHRRESVEHGKRIVGTGSLSLKHLQYYKNVSERAASMGAFTIEEMDSSSDSSSEASIIDTKHLIQRGYNKKRPLINGELEIEPIYDIVDIYRGKPNKESETSRYDLEQVGRLHVFVRILDPTDGLADTSSWDLLLKQLTTPTRYDVHVYILKANNLPAKDSSGTSDPYVRLRIGDDKGRKSKKEWVKGVVQKDTLRPEFYERFDFSCKIPGDTRLEVQVMDYDGMAFDQDDLIGSTKMDLDHRLFSKEWQAYGIRKPTETRYLWHPTSRQPQGSLQMWVDVVESKNKSFPVWDIRQPPEEEFEVRIVVWKVEKIPAGDEFSNQGDLFVKLKLGHQSWQSTDTHLFAKNGKGSFNYRLKFPVKLREGGRVHGEGAAKLKIQVWDADVFINDVLCVTQINLGRAFQNAWIMKDTGLGYQHLGDVEEQLTLAATGKKREIDGNEEDKFKDIPINWRHDPDGFRSGKAEKYENFMGAWGSNVDNGDIGPAKKMATTMNQLKQNATALNPVSLFKRESNEEKEEEGTGEATTMDQLKQNATALNPVNLFKREANEKTGEEEPLLKKEGDLETGEVTNGGYNAVNAEEPATPEEVRAEEEEKEKKKMREANEVEKKKKLSFQHQFQENLGLKTPANTKWIHFHEMDMESGQLKTMDARILMSIEILPKELAGLRKNGEGRDEPNQYPVLPPPEGRVEFMKMLYNPLYAVRACLGDTAAATVGMGCCCALFTAGFLALGVVFGPEIQITLQVLTMLPPYIDYIIYGVIVFLCLLICGFCYCNSRRPDVEDDADDYIEVDEVEV